MVDCSSVVISYSSFDTISSFSFLNHFILVAGGLDTNLHVNSAEDPSFTLIFSILPASFGES